MFNKSQNRSGFCALIQHNSAFQIFLLIGRFPLFQERAESYYCVRQTPPLWRLGRHPDHHPEVTSTNPNLCGLPMVYQTSYELRVRLTVYLFRSIGDSRRSASPSAPQSGAKRPAEKSRTEEFRDNCSNVTTFLCQQTYITISTLHPDDNQSLKGLSLHL